MYKFSIQRRVQKKETQQFNYELKKYELRYLFYSYFYECKFVIRISPKGWPEGLILEN